MEDYNYYIEKARYYREIADNLDGHRRLQVLQVARDMESKARSLAREIEQKQPKAD